MKCIKLIAMFNNLLWVEKANYGIQCLRIIAFKCWPRLRFEWPIRKVKFSTTRSSIATGTSRMTRVMLAFEASSETSLSLETRDFTLHKAPNKIVQRCDITRSKRPIHRSKTSNQLFTKMISQYVGPLIHVLYGS